MVSNKLYDVIVRHKGEEFRLTFRDWRKAIQTAHELRKQGYVVTVSDAWKLYDNVHDAVSAALLFVNRR